MLARYAITLSFLVVAHAHLTAWSKGLFGYNFPYQSNDPKNNAYDNNAPVIPLRTSDNLTVEKWWAHGLLDYPPNDGDFLELPAGGVMTVEVACNRAFTMMRDPAKRDVLPLHACPDPGPLHVVNNTYESTLPLNTSAFGGTAFAIAYTSNYTSVQPNDMTVISVNHTSPWFRLTDYAIPDGLPPCPKGGCLCTWNWIHLSGNGEGYGDEIYNNLYRCNVMNPSSGNLVASPKTPSLWEDNESKCVKGAKQPLYVYQASGNNLPKSNISPSYNSRYGFPDGAQNDIFTVSQSTSAAEKPLLVWTTGWMMSWILPILLP